MTPTFEQGQPEQTLADYLSVIRRYAWITAVMVVFVPLAAYLVASSKPKLFQASADVLLTRQNLGSAVTGVPDPNLYADPLRLARTQAELARTPEVAGRAVELARVSGMDEFDLLGRSSVRPSEDADVLGFAVTDSSGSRAARLATAYAEAFAQYKYEVDTASLSQARSELEKRLAQLRRNGSADTSDYRELVSQAQNLRTMELLQARPTVFRRALGAAQVQPTPRRDALLGGLLGLLLGLGLPFLANALDRRVRSEDEVERLLGLPLLARLPKPAHDSRAEQLSMLYRPTRASAEAIRRLRTNLELANLDGGSKVIMAASAVSVEGKSTTIANLAVALARSGRTVVLVDLDLRRPAVARFFGLDGRPGLTDVVLNRVKLADALVPVPLPVPLSMASNGSPDQTTPRLHILTTGPLPANPGEFVGTEAVAMMLQELRRANDFVLVDAPPMLPVGDGLTLATLADAVVAVVRLDVVNRPMLRDFGRALAKTPAVKLGFVLVGADDRATYGAASYGYYLDEPGELDTQHEATGASSLPFWALKGPSRFVPDLDPQSGLRARRRRARE